MSRGRNEQSISPVAEGSLVHEFEHAVNLLCDKAIVVDYLSTLLGKVHVIAKGKPLRDGGRECCGR